MRFSVATIAVPVLLALTACGSQSGSSEANDATPLSADQALAEAALECEETGTLIDDYEPGVEGSLTPEALTETHAPRGTTVRVVRASSTEAIGYAVDSDEKPLVVIEMHETKDGQWQTDSVASCVPE